VEENVGVRQRSMEAVSQGVIWGLLGSSLVVFGASVAYTSNTIFYLTEGPGLFAILTLLMALQTYTFIHLYTLNMFLLEQPKLNSGVPAVG
jgi:hypothetical protein